VPRNAAAAWVMLLFVLSFSLSVQSLPKQAYASTTVELSPSNGSLICRSYLDGPGALSAVWNNGTSTCTITANPDVGPTACIASNGTGCAEAPADVFVIDLGVTVVLQTQSGALAQFCVYSTLVNNGTIIGGSFCDYGTIINYGTIKIPIGNYFMTLPDNGFGILDNLRGGQLVNDYNFIDAGRVNNTGTIENHGQFGNDNHYHGTFTNRGTFVGSAPCFSYDGCYTWVGQYDNVTSSGTVINQLGNGVLLTITGATGTDVSVISQNQTNSAPMGLGSLNVSSALYYDVMIDGISTGTARLCIANSRVSESMAGGMQYWNGAAWTLAGNQAIEPVPMSSTPPLNATTTASTGESLMVCGDIPVADLTGTPIGAGTPLGTSQQTTSSTSATSPGSKTHSPTTSTEFTTSTSSATTPNSTGGTVVDFGPYLFTGLALILIVVALGLALSRRHRNS